MIKKILDISNKPIDNHYSQRNFSMKSEKIKATEAQLEAVLAVEDWTLDEIKRKIAHLGDSQFVSERAVFMMTPEIGERIGSTVKRAFPSTIGRLIFNLACLRPIKDLWKVMDYHNEVLNSGGIGDLTDKVTKLFIEQSIDHVAMHEFITAFNWMGFSTASFMSATLDLGTVKPSPLMKKLKKDMLADPKIKTAIATNDISTYTNAQNKVLAQVKEELEGKETSGMNIYNSGAGGSWGNNFKNVTLGRGVVPRSDDPSKFNISTAALIDGIPRDQLHVFADLSVTASSARALGTSQGGYVVKQFNAAFGSLVITSFDADCKTKHGMERSLDAKSINDYYLRFIEIGGGKLLRIDSTTKQQVVDMCSGGKTVKIRSPLYCVEKGGLCGTCAGDLFRVLDTKTIGLLSSKIGSKILLASMKAFHDMSVKVSSIDVHSKFMKIK